MLRLSSFHTLDACFPQVPTLLSRKLSPSYGSDNRNSATPPANPDDGWIIVENNFRVYAYTSRVSAMRILSIFVRLEYRLPNLVVGTITRQSARRALVDWVKWNVVVLFRLFFVLFHLFFVFALTQTNSSL
jgi:hypothetical protein